MFKCSFATVLSLVAALFGASPSVLAGPADVTLELQPPSQTEVAGHTVEIELYAKADPSEPVGMILAIIDWDPNNLELTGNHEVGAHGWAFSGFQNGGLNGTCSGTHGPCDGWDDGKAFYVAQIAGDCQTAVADADGVLVTTLVFTTTESLGTFSVSVISSQDSYNTTVCDNLPGSCGGLCDSPSLGPAVSVSVIACATHAQCDDDNYCTYDICNLGVCSYSNNYDPGLDCCNPATGALTPLDDGNECTYNVCDPDTGQVTHPNKEPGTPCGDDTDNLCTDPDTCDGLGTCDSNNAPNGSWCELDEDECTVDRCTDGVCGTISTEDDGTPCDDGQDLCTPGQDECLGGVCTGTGANPCPPLEPDLPFCQDRPQTVDSTHLVCSVTGGDCTIPEDCPNFPDEDCIPGPCRDDNDCPTELQFTCVSEECTRPFACVECAVHSDCFDDGDCYVPRCSALGECFNVVDHTLCFDEIWCDGEEQCVLSGDPLVGHCEEDPDPPCSDPDYPACLEETCCDGEVCSEDLCYCAECDNDGHCDDGEPCNGVETCNLETHVCVPGSPVNCSLGECSTSGAPCESDDQCAGQRCLKGVCSGSGAPCGDWQDCPTGQICITGICSESLTSCLYDSDCPGEEYCADAACNIGLCDSGTGQCYLELLTDYVGVPGVCDDHEPCLFLDTCTPEGACVGDPPALDGTVDLDWQPSTQIAVDIGEEVRVDLYALSNDAENWEISAVNAVLDWNPEVLQLITREDPCAIIDECPTCVEHADCAGLGVNCYCADGPPCGTVAEPSGLCITGTYDWKTSSFPGAVGLNDTWTDGDAYYIAECRFEPPEDQKAPVLVGVPLWVTTFVFEAVGGTTSTGSDVYLVPCREEPLPDQPPIPRETRVIYGAGGRITGSLGTANVRVTECWGDPDCTDNLWCTGEETCFEGKCFEGTDPCPGQLCDEDGDRCVECFIDEDCDDADLCTIDTCDFGAGICVFTPIDCDDGADCTDDDCVEGDCVYTDLCEDDGLFCTGDEFCNVAENFCDHTGDPCFPAWCDEENDTCGGECLPPLVESVGCRYLAITPQPAVNPTPVAFLVTSPDWPCLAKYVGGFYECGETGTRCFTDADCNQCVGGPYDGSCLTDEDCKTCEHNHAPCQTEADCDGNPCLQVQTCSISGETCAPHLPLDTIDISDDGLADGFIASLVDDPEDALSLAPTEWGTTTYKRCSVSFEPCTTTAECDVGRCSISQKPCSLSAQDCRNYCTESDWDCENDNDCLGGPTDTCTVPQTCEPYETCIYGRIYVTGVDILPSEGAYTTTYEVSADCGAVTDPTAAVMRRWADGDANNVVNFADIQLGVLAFMHNLSIDIPARTTISVDLVGTWPCLTNQVVNFTDILQAVLAFKGTTYNPDVLDTSDECGVPCS